MYIIAPFIAVAFLATVLLYLGRKSIQHRAACFALNKVKDDLVCLVADGKLQEDSVVFKYYYDKSKNFQPDSPIKRNHNFENLPEMQSADVRKIVEDYYTAVEKM